MGTERKHEIAIKWSAFPTDRSDLEDRAPQIIGLLIEGIDEGFLEETGDSFELSFRSTKEVRYGRVTVKPTPEGLVASGKVWEEWDAPSDLASTLGLYTGDESEDDFIVDNLRELLPFCESGEPGVEHEFSFPVTSTNQLIEQLSQEEDELLRASQEAFASISLAVEKKPRDGC